jgi:AcrR family transcriptional regulator
MASWACQDVAVGELPSDDADRSSTARSDEAVQQFLWATRPGPRRGPKPRMTLDQIVDSAIEIADADGLAAVTMQRIADLHGVTKMSLYRYVPGKAELVALMTERALGSAPGIGATGATGVRREWRPALEEWARSMLDRTVRHPWALQASVGFRAMGPQGLGWVEAAMAALADTRLSSQQKLDVAATLAGHVRAMAEQAVGAAPEDRAAESALARLVDNRPGDYPALLEVLADVAPDVTDQGFEFGLRLILDGVGLLIENRGDAGTTRD